MNYIITYCDKNYEKNLEYDFIKTLREVGYKDKLLIIDYGLTTKCAERLSKLKNVIVKKKSLDKMVYNQIHYDLKTELSLLNSEDIVMIIDGGDVWFQRNFDHVFETCKHFIGYTEEPELCNEKWMLNTTSLLTKNVKRRQALTHLQHKKLISGGMFIGPQPLMYQLEDGICLILDDFEDDFCGVDMVAINLWIRLHQRKDGNYILLPESYDFSVITNRLTAKYEHDLVYDQYGNLVHIAHNCGGENRLIKRNLNSYGVELE